MKPLSELTTNEVESELYNCVEEEQAGDVSRMLAELLRRERDRCEAACDTVVIEAAGKADYEGIHWAYECGKRIRSLP